MKLSVIIPAYNEADCLAQTVRDVFEYLEKQTYQAEVIAVNDGSTDATSKILAKLQQDQPALKTINLSENRGKGCAVKEGVMVAQGEYVLYMDADHATNIREIESMWEHIDKPKTIVIGSRGLETSKIQKKQPWFRVALGRSSNRLIQWMLLPGISDTQCGFKLFKVADAKNLFADLQTDRWAFDIEILAKAKWEGIRIIEVPVTWTNSEKSNVKKGDALRTLRELLRIRKLVNKT
ncbi:dolichyl-phosphate beta-glucosyltransferase [Patescibacteria group bacterium]